MENKINNTADQEKNEHITSYAEHFGTWTALLLLTFLTVFISIYGGKLRTMTVTMALFIASVKSLIVGLYFMHLKFDPKIYRFMIGVVIFLFAFFIFMVSIDYLTR